MYRTVVTICTAQWSLYVPHSGHCMYRTVVTISNAQWSLYVPQVVNIYAVQWSLLIPESGYIFDLGLRLCFHVEIRERLKYVSADVSCVCELILLFYVMFCLLIDGHNFEFGLVVN